MSDMKIVGMQELKKKLKKNMRMEAVKKTIRLNGSQLQDMIALLGALHRLGALQ